MNYIKGVNTKLTEIILSGHSGHNLIGLDFMSKNIFLWEKRSISTKNLIDWNRKKSISRGSKFSVQLDARILVTGIPDPERKFHRFFNLLNKLF